MNYILLLLILYCCCNKSGRCTNEIHCRCEETRCNNCNRECECERPYQPECECERPYQPECECERPCQPECECERPCQPECECERPCQPECVPDCYDRHEETCDRCDDPCEVDTSCEERCYHEEEEKPYQPNYGRREGHTYSPYQNNYNNGRYPYTRQYPQYTDPRTFNRN